MDRLVVGLALEDPDGDTWDLTIRIACRGFAGTGTCLVTGDMVRSAARCLARYPMLDNGEAVLEGGYYPRGEVGPPFILAHLSLSPHGNLGELNLHVHVVADAPWNLRSNAARLSIDAPFRYWQAAELSRGLMSLLNGNIETFEMSLE